MKESCILEKCLSRYPGYECRNQFGCAALEILYQTDEVGKNDKSGTALFPQSDLSDAIIAAGLATNVGHSKLQPMLKLTERGKSLLQTKEESNKNHKGAMGLVKREIAA